MDKGTIVWGSLAALSLGTLAVGRPWTMHPGSRRTPKVVQGHPLFRRANMVITAGWTAYFAAAAAVEAVGPQWVTWPLLAVLPALSEASHRFGPRYAMSRLGRMAGA